jgi:hypothetical protein
MAKKVKQLINEFFPGFANDQILVGMANVGICKVNATLVCNTAQTHAQIIAAPPNTQTGPAVPCGPIVHSFGTAPSFTFVTERHVEAAETSMYGVAFAFITANNSAVFLKATTYTTNHAKGVAVTLYAIR